MPSASQVAPAAVVPAEGDSKGNGSPSPPGSLTPKAARRSLTENDGVGPDMPGDVMLLIRRSATGPEMDMVMASLLNAVSVCVCVSRYQSELSSAYPLHAAKPPNRCPLIMFFFRASSSKSAILAIFATLLKSSHSVSYVRAARASGAASAAAAPRPAAAPADWPRRDVASVGLHP